MEGFLKDLRFALRMVVKSPGMTAVAVASLAVGLAANVTIFTFVNAVLLNTRLIAAGEVTSVLTSANIDLAYRGGHCAHTDDPLKQIRTAQFPN